MATDGERFGAYTLLEKLGEGGMGEVWKALDTRLERVVALKLMKSGDETNRKALIAEAKTACQLKHPNIAVIFEAGEHEDVPFIAMELVEGRPLGDRLGERLGEAEILALARQAAEALHHAHQKGIIHRDIKPDNLLHDGAGHLEILDFGIAKRNPPLAGGDATAPTLLHLTQPGVSMGTPAYMSPEQVFGRPVTSAADQFSLGVVLRELAVGERIFKRETMVETLHAVAKDEPWRLLDLRPDLSPSLCSALDKMIEKDPLKRFPDLQAFLESLPLGVANSGPLLAAAPVPQKDTVAPWRSVAMALGGLAAAGLLGFGAFRHFRAAPDALPAPGQKVVAILPVEITTADPSRAWVATSLADAMNTSLLRRGDVRVLDRQWVAEAVRRTGLHGASLVEGLTPMGRELRADLLVVGEGEWKGDRLEVRMRLFGTGQEAALSELKAEGNLSELLVLEDNLSTRLPGLIGLAAPAEPSMPMASGTGGANPSKARNLRTRELYARALELADRGNIDSYDAARSLFLDAISLEPDYASAHAGLAWALQDMGATEAHLGRQEKALTHFREAESVARKAIALDPRSSMALRALGGALIRQSRFQEARPVATLAVSLDPVDHHALVGLADAYAYSDLPDDRLRASRQYARTVEIAPSYWYAHFRYAVHLQNQGDLENSVQEADRAVSLQPSAEYGYLTSALSLLWLGRHEEARSRLESGMLQVPGSRLLKLTKAVVAHAARDLEAFMRLKSDLKGAWPPSHVIPMLLEGLEADLKQGAGGARRRFLGEAARAKGTDWSGRPASDRRGASVNLYHMARALALRGESAPARELLAVSESLNPGKVVVASKDPAFRALK